MGQPAYLFSCFYLELFILWFMFEVVFMLDVLILTVNVLEWSRLVLGLLFLI